MLDDGSRGGVGGGDDAEVGLTGKRPAQAIFARLEGCLAPAGLAALALPPLHGGTPSEDRPAAVMVDRGLCPEGKRQAFGLALARLRATGGGWARLREVRE